MSLVLTKWRRSAVVLVWCAGLILGFRGCIESPLPPAGDATQGKVLFEEGDTTGVHPGCQNCHCTDASGGCGLSAPNIQGKSYDLVNARTRDPAVSHPGGKFDFTDQDVADIVAYLATLVSED